MKRCILSVLVAFVFGISGVVPAYVQAAEPQIQVCLNGSPITFNVPPIQQENRTLVPMRDIFDALDADIVWEQSVQRVTAAKGEDILTLQIGNPVMQKNGEEMLLDIPPCLIAGQTMVPLRAVAEAFGLEVWWLEDTQTVALEAYSNQMSVGRYSIRRLTEPSAAEGDSLFSAQNGMIRFEQYGKYGFVNALTGSVIPAKYDSANDFADNGLAIVQKDGYYGVIDQNEQTVIPFEYTTISRFDENGAALASKTDNGLERWGKINIKGEILTPFEHNSAESAETGLVIVTENGKTGLNTEDGDTVLPLSACTISQNTHGLGYTIAGYFETDKRQEQYCNINAEGNIVFSDYYDEIYPHINGIARVKRGSAYGYINTNGELVIPLVYEEAETFSEGLAFVKKDGKWGFINTAGEVVTAFLYDGDAVQTNTGVYYMAFDSHFRNGYAKVRIGDKFGVIDKSGKPVVPVVYDDIKEDYTFELLSQSGIILVKNDGFWGIADVNGNLLVDCRLNWIDDFSEGYAVFGAGQTYETPAREPYYLNSEHYGVVSVTGEITAYDLPLNPMYYYNTVYLGMTGSGASANCPTRFCEGLLAAQDENGKWGNLNPMGEVVIPPRFDTVTLKGSYSLNGSRYGEMAGAGDFQNGLALVYIDGAYNIIDRQGSLLLDSGWEDISRRWESMAENPAADEYFICRSSNGEVQIVANGVEPVLVFKDGAVRDQNGGILLHSSFPLLISQVGNGIFRYVQDDKYGLFMIQSNP